MRRFTSRASISSAVGAVLLIVGLIIGAGVGYAVTSSGKGSTTTITQNGGGSTVTVGGSTATVTAGQSTVTLTSGGGGTGLSGTIPVGVAYELTGSIADYGTDMKDAVLLAINDTNTLLASENSSVRFQPIVLDTQSTPSAALQAAQTLVQSDHVQVIFGPLTSGEIQAMQSYVDQQHVVEFACCSTALQLAIPNDYIFRFLPTSVSQGPPIAKEALSRGINKVVAITIQNDYANSILGSFNTTFTAGGGKIVNLIQYNPSETDHSAEVSQLSSDIAAAGPHTGVLFIAYTTDGLDILQKASVDPTLTSVTWLCDDNCPTSNFLPPQAPASVAQFMEKVNMTSSLTAASGNYVYQQFVSEFKAAYGRAPLPQVQSAYDSARVGLMSILVAGKYSGPAIQAVVSTVASNMYGAVGPDRLDANGDLASEPYEVDQIQTNSTGGFTWVKIATYDPATQQLSPVT
ncbi:MAG TPA: penicillin-binding protein activator [Nitrososphaerales archaeon]|nr:penicillin-binding protein activator [Nitrososphaerales archaeon]